MMTRLHILLVSSLLFAMAAFAPVRISAQVSFNVGYINQEHTFAYQNGTLDSLRQDGVWMKGAIAGLSSTVPFIGRISITPGVYISFAQLNEQIGDSLRGFTNPTTSNINLKMPFFLSYKIPLGSGFTLLLFGGPVFNMGISSLANYRNVGTQLDAHFDMGGSIAVGLQFHRLRLFMGYNASLIDRDDFSLANKESLQKAWEGSSFFMGLGLSLGEKTK